MSTTEHIKIGDLRPWEQVEQKIEGNQIFPYPFPIFTNDDLEVYLDGVLQTIGEFNDYVIDGAGKDEGGTVTFNTAPDVDAVVTMRRRLDIQRTSDFQESGEFRAKVLNDELDYQTAAIQQVSDDVKRALRLPATDPDATLELPDRSARAGNFLWFNSEGDLVIAAGLATIAISDAMESVVQANTGAEALNILSPYLLKANTSENLEVGYTQDWHDLGNTGTSTITPAFADSNRQKAMVTGAFTLAGPTGAEGSILMKFTNDATGPHSPTFSGDFAGTLPGSKTWDATNSAVNWVMIQREGTASHYGIYNDA